ncbi:MAG: hypothetical protein V1753_00745 [Pseudomonadota bacterium]
MLKDDFIKISPLKILEHSSQRSLGKGNLGVLIARAGVGKTACLIHIALANIFSQRKLFHVAIDESTEKVSAYYRTILSDLGKALNFVESEAEEMIVERNRIIMAYPGSRFSLDVLDKGIENLIKAIDIKPDTLIIDGLDFENVTRDMISGFKNLAEKHEVEIWLSALSHRHIRETNEKGIPHPCNRLDDLLSLIIYLDPTDDGVFLRLLKDHDVYLGSETSYKLDPATFLVADPQS